MANGQSQNLKHKLAGLGLFAQSALIGCALLAAWLLLSPLAMQTAGAEGLQAAAIAAVVCWLGAQFSLAIAALIGEGASLLSRIWLGMAARAMFPLVIGTALHIRNPGLNAAGLIFYVLVFYMVTLAADTALLLSRVPEPLAPTSRSLAPKKAH
jgi:hypothetical protein